MRKMNVRLSGARHTWPKVGTKRITSDASTRSKCNRQSSRLHDTATCKGQLPSWSHSPQRNGRGAASNLHAGVPLRQLAGHSEHPLQHHLHGASTGHMDVLSESLKRMSAPKAAAAWKCFGNTGRTRVGYHSSTEKESSLTCVVRVRGYWQRGCTHERNGT
jgi:hypothetical protein